ncbi:MAG: hypothetical protein HY043_05195 [Verrucomicrobia bacterium]|nr:hypothetical protein [Verrucomicrobiota bacterium]
MNPLAKITRLIKQSMGLDAACYGATLFNQVVQERFRASGLPALEDFCRHCEQSGDARQELIEALIVPETWFFRGRESFAALAQWMRTEWLPAHAGETLRLLSAPCSTGEEPYSLAMTLLDAGLPARSFRIDAVDISKRSVELARQATYRKNSFREKQSGFRERYFRTADGCDVLLESVRRTVNFQVGNLAGADLPATANHYHVIFCRNLLIYFDGPTQWRVIESYRTQLAPNGLLFVGHAEANALTEHGFVPLKHLQAFGYRKRASENPRPTPSDTTITVGDPGRLNLKQPAARARRKLTTNIPGPSIPNALRPTFPLASTNGHAATSQPFSNALELATADDRLLDVQRLADQGRLPEAAARCQAHLREQGPSANAYFWLGVVHDAAGQPESASECYRKAIYLQPGHTEALWHLALLVEKIGEAQQARGWRRRAERVTERSRR